MNFYPRMMGGAFGPATDVPRAMSVNLRTTDKLTPDGAVGARDFVARAQGNPRSGRAEVKEEEGMGEADEETGLSIWDVMSKSQLAVMLRAAEDQMFVPDYSSMTRDELAAAMRARFEIVDQTLRVKEGVNGLPIGDLLYKPRMQKAQRQHLGKSARRLLRGKPTRARATSVQLYGARPRKFDTMHTEPSYVTDGRCDVGYKRFMGRCVRRTRHGPVPPGLCGNRAKFVRGPDGKCYDLLTEKAVEVSPAEIERRREARRAMLATRLGRARAMRSRSSAASALQPEYAT